MPEWVWMVAIFVMGGFGYWLGLEMGWHDMEKAPTENAWINVRRYSVDANKEIQLRALEARHEEEMAIINRGAYDHLNIEDDGEDDDEDPQDLTDTKGLML